MANRSCCGFISTVAVPVAVWMDSNSNRYPRRCNSMTTTFQHFLVVVSRRQLTLSSSTAFAVAPVVEALAGLLLGRSGSQQHRSSSSSSRRHLDWGKHAVVAQKAIGHGTGSEPVAVEDVLVRFAAA
jgi:hypothetical protein